MHLVSLSFSVSVCYRDSYTFERNDTKQRPKNICKSHFIHFKASLQGVVLQLYEVTGLYKITLKPFFYFWVVSLSYWGLESVSLFSGVVTLQPADPQQAFSWV